MKKVFGISNNFEYNGFMCKKECEGDCKNCPLTKKKPEEVEEKCPFCKEPCGNDHCAYKQK